MNLDDRQIKRPKTWLIRVNAFIRSKFLIILIILLVFSAALIAGTSLFKKRHDNEGLVLLKVLSKNRRLIQSRIVGFEYAPLINPRGTPEKPAAVGTSVEHTERVLLDAIFYSPDANSHHDLGVFHLLNKRFADAIHEFELALTYKPDSAKLHCDLGAALFEAGKAELAKERQQTQFTGKPVEYLARSIEHLHQSLASDASLTEATFNLGLVQAALGLRNSARDTFSKYSTLDFDFNWAREAREVIYGFDEKDRASALSQQELMVDFVNAFEEKDEERAWKGICENRSALNGKYLADLLIDDYIDQTLAGKKEGAKHSLSALSFLARLEVNRADEHYTDVLSEYYRTRGWAQLALLKRARELVRQGHDLYFHDKESDAIAAYVAAKNEFDRLNDKSESLATEYRIAYCKSESGHSNTLSVFKKLAGLSDQQKFRVLQIRNLLGVASGEFSHRAYSEAIKQGLQSLELATKVGDEATAFAALDSTMEFYRAVKNDKKVLACIQNNFEYANSPSINQLQSFVHYSRVASALVSAGYVDASLVFRSEASAYLIRDVPRDSALYFADLGATYTLLKKYDDAITSLNHASEEANSISQDSAKSLVLAYVKIFTGYLHSVKAEWESALSSYDEALSLSENAHFPAFEYEARKGRLHCYIALSQDTMAEGEITETLKLLESNRAEILEQENRNSFFDAEQDVFDLAIDYQYSRQNDPARAFYYSEESRSRSLLNLLMRQEDTSFRRPARSGTSPNDPPALALGTIQHRLPEGLQVIEYSVLADKILIWVLDSNHFATASFEITQEDLKKKIKAYIDNISHYNGDDSGSFTEQSKELFDILVKPVSHLLKRDEVICVVADKVLSNLPFETLISPETQTYLVEDFAFLYSPSSSILIACNEEARIRQSLDKSRLLAVANPNFDRSLFRELDDLPAAQTEVERISAYYQTPVVLMGAAAREGKVTSEMRSATVIHFAAHSLLDEDSVLRSKILLSKEPAPNGPENDGFLESGEISQMSLPNTQLVVLSSCQSGIDRYYNGEGMMSLARSFMGVGVPTVVASLWEVDSTATANLMIEFHRLRQREGLSVAKSLRNAKLAMIADRNIHFRHPFFWGAFQVIGGQAEFH